VAFRMKDFGLLATSFYWRNRICRFVTLRRTHGESPVWSPGSLRALRGVERPILPASWKWLKTVLFSLAKCRRPEGLHFSDRLQEPPAGDTLGRGTRC